MQLRHLGHRSDEAHLFQRLANQCSIPTRRCDRPARSSSAARARRRLLWAQGISGDLPIVLVRVEEDHDLDLVRQLLRAHEYWRLKQLAVDLVILNERAASDVQEFQTALEALVRMNKSMPRIVSDDSRGAVFVAARRSRFPGQFAACFTPAPARCSTAIAARWPSRSTARAMSRPPPRRQLRRAQPTPDAGNALPRPAMEFFNGLGGFANDGREYLTILGGDDRTPAPWVNIIANPSFGFQVSTDGGGFTWSVNSQQNQLTPWSNDPVGDATGRGDLCARRGDRRGVGPDRAADTREARPIRSRHGQGYSRVRTCLARDCAGAFAIRAGRRFDQDLAAEDHQSFGARAAAFRSPPMWNGCSARARSATAPFVVTEIDPETGAIFAQNPWNDRFGERVAFADLTVGKRRGPAIVRNSLGRDGAIGSTAWPWRRERVLSNRVGAGLDPCGALQTQVTGSAPAARRRSSFSSGRRRPSGGAIPAREVPRGRSRRGVRRRHPAMGRYSRGRAGQDARPRAGYSSSTAGFPIRRWRAGYGRARPSTRRAAPTAFATSCRT